MDLFRLFHDLPVRLIWWLSGMSWVRNRILRGQVERIERGLNAAGISSGRPELIHHHLFNNAFIGWRWAGLKQAPADDFIRRISVDGRSRLEGALDKGQGVILVLCETPSWPVLLRLLELWGIDGCLVVRGDGVPAEKDGAAIGGSAVERGIDALNLGGVVVVIADSFKKGSTSEPRPFLGKMCYLNRSFVECAISTNCRVLPVLCRMDSDGKITIKFEAPFESGDAGMSREERVNLFIDQYWANLQTLWTKDFGNVPRRRLDDFCDQEPVTESVSYSPPWKPEGERWPLTMTDGGFQFLLVERPDWVELDSSFEDRPTIYTEANIEKLIEKYRVRFGKPVRFISMNQRHCNDREIVYRNFSWGLYREVTPARTGDIRFSFTYLVGFPRPDKLEMLSALHEKGLLDDALWSCGSLPNDEGRNLPDLPRVLDFDKSLKHVQTCWTEIQREFYEHSRFSLVQETEMQASTNRYTEKTYKCFWMKHPFLVAGNYGAMELLRRDGFRTFHPFIDESYDQIEDQAERIAAIVREVDRLCKMSDDEWGELRKEVEPVLEHNYGVAVRKSAQCHRG